MRTFREADCMSAFERPRNCVSRLRANIATADFSALLFRFTLALGLVAASNAAAAQSGADLTTERGQHGWRAIVDLRELPAESRAASVRAVVDARAARRAGLSPRVSIAINGVVVARSLAGAEGPTELRATLEDRLVSTRSRIEVAVTANAPQCRYRACQLPAETELQRLDLQWDEAASDPRNFSEFVTRFRAGIRVEAVTARDQAFADRAIAAIAPHATRTAEGPGAIIVGDAVPQGTDPPLRFDTGPVDIVDRDGKMLYDAAALDRLTVVQILRHDDGPILWVRPGPRAVVPAEMELDHGQVALFGAGGREIAFSPALDRDVRIRYEAHQRLAEMRSLYVKAAIGIGWLLASLGLAWLYRRAKPARKSEVPA